MRVHGMPSGMVPFGTHAVKARLGSVMASLPGTHRWPSPQLAAEPGAQQ